MHMAEQETKAKQERIAEIKRIASQIASVKSDMGRFEEQLEDCRRYRDFLYTPPPLASAPLLCIKRCLLQIQTVA